jgi:REP element-mobilizing transposase RayT
MPLPRYKQINTDVTPYYHCISGCVRQSFLCGKDRNSGTNYEHRRKWIQKRLHELTKAFAINLCAYAVMHNHLHVVLHIAKARAEAWSMDEVLLRWRMFYKCPAVVQRYLDEPDAVFTDDELAKIEALSVTYRQRLQCISWFMKLLNEYIARKANKEDGCTGYFWERRFRSQAILDDKALASVLAYVDLNPIRAHIASTLQNSKFTSIQYRLNAQKAAKVPKFLMPFKGQCPKRFECLPFSFEDYLHLLEHTRSRKANMEVGTNMKPSTSPLTKLNITEEDWCYITTNFEKLFCGPAGSPNTMHQFAEATDRHRSPNMANAQRYLA